MNGTHLSDMALVVLAASRKSHPHLDSCAYCREQYRTLIEMEEFEAEADMKAPDAKTEVARYRLAAQSDVQMDADLILRQTWYLDEGRLLLRVFEEDGTRLIGYVICAPERLAKLRVRFSGIDKSFVPASDGSFVIGSVALPIEPMAVTIEEIS